MRKGAAVLCAAAAASCAVPEDASPGKRRVFPLPAHPSGFLPAPSEGRAVPFGMEPTHRKEGRTAGTSLPSGLSHSGFESSSVSFRICGAIFSRSFLVIRVYNG